jgi:PmbA protein
MMPEMESKKEAAHYLLEQFRKKGADDIIVSASDDHTSQIKFYNSKIATTQTWMSAKMEVFVAIKKKLISTSIKDFSKEALADSVDRLMKFAASASPTGDYMGIAKGPFSYNQPDETFDPKVAELGDKAVDLTEAALNAAAAHGSNRSAGVFESQVSGSYLLTSSGVEASDRGTHLYMSLRAFSKKDASGHCMTNSRVLSKFNVEDPATRAADTAKQALNPQPGVPGNYDILFEPLPFSNFLCQVSEASSIFNVESGLSCLTNQLGQKVGSDAVSLYDDATLPNAFGAVSFDAEGVPAQRTPILEAGIMKSYLHNTSTARRHNTKSTGNAGIVSPAAFNVVFKNGNLNKEEMLHGMKRGLVVTNVWYTRFQNYSTGDFSTIPRDGMFLVEDGKITGPVRELRISDNVLRMLKNVADVGNNSERVFGWEVETPVETPSVVVRDVRVTKSVA